MERNVARTRARLPAGTRVIASLAEIPPDTPIDAIVDLAGAPVIGPPWTARGDSCSSTAASKTTQALLDWCATRAVTRHAH